MGDDRIGTILDDRYQILDRIAAGGMGVVYKGERLKLGRSVAIKFLHAWMAADDSFKKRFEIEAKAMAMLQHPNCTSVTDFGIDNGEPYVVMDFVPGESLRKLLDREPMAVGRAIDIARQVLSGLAHAHGQGITHRDIKPDNVMVDTSSSQFGAQVRILDFGLAKMRESSGLTTGFVVGTPSYMAPEQTMGDPVDERTDVYAVGVLLFEMLTGNKPFVADEAAQVIRMHRMEPPPRLAALAPGASFSAELQAAVDRALAKDPGHRFQSAADFAAALDAVPEAAHTRSPSSSDARAPMGPAMTALGTAETAMLQSDALIPVSSPGMASPGTMPTEQFGVATSQQPASAQMVAPGAQMAAPAAHPGAGLAPQAAHVSPPAMHSGVQPVDPRMPVDPRTMDTSGYAPLPPARPRRTLGVVAVVGVLGLIIGVAVWASQSSSDETAGQTAGQAAGEAADQALAAGASARPDGPADTRVAASTDKDKDEDKDKAQAAGTDKDKDKAQAAGTGTDTDKAQAVGTTGAQADEPAEFTRLKERIKAGNTRGATKELEKLKRKYKSNAEIPYVLGQLYLGKLWVNDGLEAFREAILRDPKYRNDADLIKAAIIGLANDKYHYKVRRFLVREVGQPAVPYLEDAARTHQSERIRERATRALREIR